MDSSKKGRFTLDIDSSAMEVVNEIMQCFHLPEEDEMFIAVDPSGALKVKGVDWECEAAMTFEIRHPNPSTLRPLGCHRIEKSKRIKKVWFLFNRRGWDEMYVPDWVGINLARFLALDKYYREQDCFNFMCFILDVPSKRGQTEWVEKILPNEMALKPGDPVRMDDMQGKYVHCGIYLGYGFYLSKIGTSDFTLVATFDELAKVYSLKKKIILLTAFAKRKKRPRFYL